MRRQRSDGPPIERARPVFNMSTLSRLTWVVILFLPEDEAQFAPEHGPLLRAVAVFSLFAAAAAISMGPVTPWQ